MASTHTQNTMAPYDSNTDCPVSHIPIRIPADPQYYQSQRFLIEDPKQGIAWLKAIGAENSGKLAAVRVYVPAGYNWLDLNKPLTGPGWCALFEWLVVRATALEDVKIFWECDTRDWADGCLGGGSDPDMLFAVKYLKGLRGLERLEFSGFYDDTWVEALSDQLDLEASTVEEALKAKGRLSTMEKTYLENLAIFRVKM